MRHSSALIVLLPLCCCLINIKTLNATIRVLFIYICFSVLADLLGFIFMHNKVQTHLLYNTFTVIECSLLVLIYYLNFEDNRTRNLMKIFYTLFVLLAITILFIGGKYNRQENVLSSYEAVFLVFLSVAYFYKLMLELNIPKLREFYFTWINTGILIYFSTGFILFLFKEYIEQRGIKTYYLLYSLHWLSHIAYNILLTVGIWKTRRI